MSLTLERAITGCILGTAVGDALGLCCEGLSPRRQRRLFPQPGRYHFFLGKGMCSDDTEHTCMTAHALLVSGGEPGKFARSLAWRLRWWLLGLPAGIGFATLRAILKLWLGFPPDRSGVFSAGNGPAMRSAILGVCFGQDQPRLRELVGASTRLTHTDPKAEHAALAVALAAGHSCRSAENRSSMRDYCGDLARLLGPEAKGFLDLVEKAWESAERGEDTTTFARQLGLDHGVTGYAYHTVPVALHAWFRHGDDYRQAVLGVIACGGDTDTTAAIVGGIVGAGAGKEGIPAEWLANLWEWPQTVTWMERLGRALATAAPGVPQRGVPLNIPALLLRNLFFALVVLGHGFRRLLPPY